MKLTEDQISFFNREGYLVAENIVTDSDLAPVIAEYEAWIEARANDLHSRGEISDLHADAPFEKRLALLSAQNAKFADGIDIMQARGEAMHAFLYNRNLLDAVECLVGPEITCNPIQHLRAKPPSAVEAGGYYNVPWHQDSAVTWEEADSSNIVTCWIAMVDATVQNGCMEVIPGVFRLGYLPHHSGDGGTTVRPEALPDVTPVPVPVRKGGAVFMHRCTPHRSTPNFTDAIRWSIDLRYQPIGQPTGRPFYPDFVVRSESHSITPDYNEWVRRWVEALENSKSVRWHRV
jgi:ectoine hydroxylase-related dioxygenase (phytanoyl-CoA dioxygenase family)